MPLSPAICLTKRREEHSTNDIQPTYSLPTLKAHARQQPRAKIPVPEQMRSPQPSGVFQYRNVNSQGQAVSQGCPEKENGGRGDLKRMPVPDPTNRKAACSDKFESTVGVKRKLKSGISKRFRSPGCRFHSQSGGG